MEIISSLKSEYIQTARELKSIKGRKFSGKILLEGEEIISWALKNEVKIEFIITSLENIKLFNDSIDSIIPVFKTTEGLMKKITDTKYLIPIIAVGHIDYKETDNDFILVLDNVKDFGNIGTIIRTAQAFGIKKVVFTGNEIDLFQKKTIEASRGTVFKTQFDCFNSPEETLKYLRKNNYQIISTSPYGSRLQSLVNLKNKPVALIVGNETSGISEFIIKNSDFTIQIPLQENVESLNVGVAAGISVYELKLKQVINMIEQKIKSTLGREVNVASILIRDALDKELKKASFLSSHQLVFIMVLKCDEKMSKVEIQKQFGIPDSDFVDFLKPLKDNGFIWENSPGYFSITEKGIEIIGKLWTIVENTENKIFSKFSMEEKAMFMNMISRIKENCLKI